MASPFENTVLKIAKDHTASTPEVLLTVTTERVKDTKLLVYTNSLMFWDPSS